ncbi:MAG: hypothetical protein WC637_14775, partial [Victivallales bacterium]
MSRFICRFLTGLMFLVAIHTVVAAEWEMSRPAISFDRFEFSGADQAERIKAAGSVSGYKDKWSPIAGWMEYDV